MACLECSPSEPPHGDPVANFASAYSELMQSRTRFETAFAELSQATKRFAVAQHQVHQSAGSTSSWPPGSMDNPPVVQGLETTSDGAAPAPALEWNPTRVRDALLSALLEWGPGSVAAGLPGPSSSSTPSYPPYLMDALSVSWPGVPEVHHEATPGYTPHLMDASSGSWPGVPEVYQQPAYTASADPFRFHSSQGVPEEHGVVGHSKTSPVHVPPPQQERAPDGVLNVACPPCKLPCAHTQQLTAPPGLPSMAALVPAPTAALLSTAGLPCPLPPAVAPSQSSQAPTQKQRAGQIPATAAIPESMAQAEAEMPDDDSIVSAGTGNESLPSSRQASEDVAAKTPETAPTTFDSHEDSGGEQSVGQDLSQDYAAAVTSFLTGDVGAMAEEGGEEGERSDKDVNAEAMPKGMPTPEECMSFSKCDDPLKTPSLNFHEFSPAAETHQTVKESVTTQLAPQALCQKRQRPQVPSEPTDAAAQLSAIGAPNGVLGVFPPRPDTRAAVPPNALAYEPHSAWHQLSLAIAARPHGAQPDVGPLGIAHASALETAVQTASSPSPFLFFPASLASTEPRHVEQMAGRSVSHAQPASLAEALGMPVDLPMIGPLTSASQSLPVGAAAPVSRHDAAPPVQVQASLYEYDPCAAFSGCRGEQVSECHDADSFEPTAEDDDTNGRKESSSHSQGKRKQQAVRPTLDELLSGMRSSTVGYKGQVRPETEALAIALMEEGVSTLMIRNLPHTLTQKQFKEELGNTGFRDLFDFFYMPTCFGTGAGKGYAFVNLVTTQAVGAFVREWHFSRRFTMTAPDSPLNVSKADVQGRAQNAKKWSAPRMRRVRNPALRPLVIDRAVVA